jgi:chaperonin GroES
MVSSVVSLPIDPNADPNRPRLDEALAVVADHAAAPLSASAKLASMAQTSGDVSYIYPPEKLAEIGETCVSAYDRDKRERKDWEDVAREALDACSQDEQDKAKTFPWAGASNMKWPLLTIASMQFNARMYPAIVKGDEAVLCKVIGQDNGKPATAPNPISGAIQPVPAVDPATGTFAKDEQGMPQPHWLIPPGAKALRARRVSEYMNTTLFYRMETWEDDTDQLLMELPAVGCKFRKLWTDENGQQKSATVSALNLIVPINTRTLSAALRITEEIENVYPHEIDERMRSGYYRTVDLHPMPKDGKPVTEEGDGARVLLEQHCRWDFDEDGIAEPYVVTLDKETHLVLRIEPNFGPNEIRWLNKPEGRVPVSIAPRQFYVKYGMFPHPKGTFYDIGLGHLLKKMGDGVDTLLNQLIDAGTAQTAGGGFIGSGVRLQARGSRGSIRFSPGEYKTVDVSGDTLRSNVVERTLPNVSPVTFQVLEMILGAMRDIAGIKDVMTGEASNMGQVGTTLALIEQGLQVFNSCAKRIFRTLKAEFELLYDNMRLFGGELLAQDYTETLDDPQSNFAADFDEEGLDIRPVSDPASITRMQKMARAQFLLTLMPQIASVGGDAREIVKRVLEAVDTEDIDKVLPPPPPLDPMQQQLQQQQIALTLRKMAGEAEKVENQAGGAYAKALLDAAKAAEVRFNLSTAAGEHGVELGIAAAHTQDPAQ